MVKFKYIASLYYQDREADGCMPFKLSGEIEFEGAGLGRDTDKARAAQLILFLEGQVNCTGLARAHFSMPERIDG